MQANFRKFERGWDDGRVATAFFRGTATGGGTTIDNNQRLKVAHLSHIWKDDPEKGGEEPFLNAAIVGWNLRDKKVAEGPMTFLRPGNFAFTAGKHHFTPIYEQSMYKYLVYVDGHWYVFHTMLLPEFLEAFVLQFELMFVCISCFV